MSRKAYQRFVYSEEDLRKALQEIKNGMSLNKVSKLFSIPKSTLHNKINNKVAMERKMGPHTILTKSEELEIKNKLLKEIEQGSLLGRKDVKDTIKNILSELPRKNVFANNNPGGKWLTLFLKRHPDILMRCTGAISKDYGVVRKMGDKPLMDTQLHVADQVKLQQKLEPLEIINMENYILNKQVQERKKEELEPVVGSCKGTETGPGNTYPTIEDDSDDSSISDMELIHLGYPRSKKHLKIDNTNFDLNKTCSIEKLPNATCKPSEVTKCKPPEPRYNEPCFNTVMEMLHRLEFLWSSKEKTNSHREEIQYIITSLRILGVIY